MNGMGEEIFESDYENSYEGEGDYEGEGESYEAETEWGAQGETGGSPFSQEQEMELAAELLSVSNEQELEQFLGDLFKKVGKVAGKIVNSPVGKALGGALKQAAKTALPIVGSAVGGYFGGPMGAQLGGKLAAAGGQIFGLELEGLSNEDKEFEMSRRYVRFAGSAAMRAARYPRSMHPRRVARAALVAAARRHAPGFLRNGFPQPVPADYSYYPERWRARHRRWRMHDLDRTVPAPAPAYDDADVDVDPNADGGDADLDPEIFGEIAATAQPPQGPAPGQPGNGVVAVPAGYPHHRGHHATSGRWVRRGNVLMVLGV
ncbi:MAG TPA: hypothetical protein VGM86_12460 [Thermoanaerobaculia bacterium]